MRLCSFSVDDRVSFGLVAADGIVDLGARLGGTLQDVLRDDRVAAAVEAGAGVPADHAVGDVTLLPPVPAPEKIVCVGVNYANRNAEYKDGSNEPDWPSLFLRAPDSFTGHGQDLWRPPESHQLDYEGEIAIIVGKTGHRVAREDALSHIAGLTLMNEGTIRDWVRHAKFNVTQGKNFMHSGSIGPWLVTADAFDGYGDLSLTTRVNGEQRQHDSTANLMFPFDFLLSYLSTFFVLKPGDVISTGTPPGAGARFDPPRYLAPGDVVEVDVPGIGILRNGVVDDPTVA